MPKYYNIEDWEGLKSVKIIPEPWYRRLPILKNCFQYRVGDQIRFKLLIEKNSTKGHYVIAEVFGEKETLMGVIDKVEYPFVGTRIPIEQSIAYCIINNEQSNRIRKNLIFTTTVLSSDTIRAKWRWAFIGALFSLIVGMLLWGLGIIQITPFWIITP